jgi:hypothetical protein
MLDGTVINMMTTCNTNMNHHGKPHDNGGRHSVSKLTCRITTCNITCIITPHKLTCRINFNLSSPSEGCGPVEAAPFCAAWAGEKPKSAANLWAHRCTSRCWVIHWQSMHAAPYIASTCVRRGRAATASTRRGGEADLHVRNHVLALDGGIKARH